MIVEQDLDVVCLYIKSRGCNKKNKNVNCDHVLMTCMNVSHVTFLPFFITVFSV